MCCPSRISRARHLFGVRAAFATKYAVDLRRALECKDRSEPPVRRLLDLRDFSFSQPSTQGAIFGRPRLSYARFGVFFGALLLVVLWGEVSIRAPLIGVQQVAQVVTLLVLGDWVLGAMLYRRERLAALVLWWTGALMVAAFLVHLWVGA